MAIGAEEMAGLGALEPDRRRQPVAQRALDRRVRRQHGRQQRAQHERDHDRERNHGRPAALAGASLEDRGLGRGGAAHREYRIFGLRYA